MAKGNRENKIKKTMRIEHCDRLTAEKFVAISERLVSPDFTPEEGRRIYKELEELRAKNREQTN